MADEADVKRRVREFYDTVGWKQVGGGLYQNIRYEDQRAVSQEYIRACRRRVARHLPATGKYLLDAGSGPIQYPEYVEYSRPFRYRVCVDISRLALQEARRRIGPHGLFVLGDLVHLPFRPEAFAGLISMHVVYHLPAVEQAEAFSELYRVLDSPGRGVVVYSWGRHSPLMRVARFPLRAAEWLRRVVRRQRVPRPTVLDPDEAERQTLLAAPGHYSHNHPPAWIQERLRTMPRGEIRIWRSLPTRFLRTFIHRALLGRLWLKLVWALEERFPRAAALVGQYPMILFDKAPAEGSLPRGAP
jgi:SAM-dependent methyltransferase